MLLLHCSPASLVNFGYFSVTVGWGRQPWTLPIRLTTESHKACALKGEAHRRLRWRLEPSSTLSLHMRRREYVIIISQGCSSSLIQLSQESLSKNSSRHIDWKSVQRHQSTYCLHSVLYFFFFCGTKKNLKKLKANLLLLIQSHQ